MGTSKMAKKITIKPVSKIRSKEALPDDVEKLVSDWINKPETKEQNTRKSKVVRVNFDIDEDIHNSLKIYCFKNKTTIKNFCLGVILEAIKDK